MLNLAFQNNCLILLYTRLVTLFVHVFAGQPRMTGEDLSAVYYGQVVYLIYERLSQLVTDVLWHRSCFVSGALSAFDRSANNREGLTVV